MRVEDLSVVLRPRRPWEAADLGCALVRRDYGRIMVLWLATVVPVWIGLAVVLRDHPLWFGFCVWWLKPLYDRVPLFFLSRAAFGARPGFRETWKEWPRLWGRFLLPALLWRRLSLIRSFALPVWILEGAKGSESRKRIRGLAMDSGSTATKVTIAFVHIEVAAALGLLGLTYQLAPGSGLPPLEDLVIDGIDGINPLSDAFYWYSNVIYLLAITLVEPFFVGAGFGLYLNCRSKLEGWDIEVAFRKLAARVEKMLVKVALIALLLFATSMVPAVRAQEADDDDVEVMPAEVVSDSRSERKNAAKETIGSVLEREEFEIHKKTGREWIEEESQRKNEGDRASLGMQVLLKLIMWGIAITGVGFLLVMLMRYLSKIQAPMKSVRQKPPPVRTVMGMELGEETLPADLLDAARRYWDEGRHRDALSLLYRGALSRLVGVRRVPIEASDTEDDCLLRVTQNEEPQIVAYFALLTRQWVAAAYAGREASAGEFEGLCEGWPFEGLPARSRSIPVVAKASMVALAFCVLAACNGGWEDVEREVGYKGKARVDPFLAAQEFLTERGHEAERSAAFRDLPWADDGVIFTTAENGMPSATAQPLLDWVDEGGHLIYVMAGGAPYNDWRSSGGLRSAYVLGEEIIDPVLEALGVEVALGGSLFVEGADSEDEQEVDGELLELEAPEDEVAGKGEASENEVKKEDAIWRRYIPEKKLLKWKKHKLELELMPSLTFVPEVAPGRGEFGVLADFDSDGEMEKGDADTDGEGDLGPQGYQVLSLKYGYGRVTLLNDARPLRNRYLGDADHALWLDLMVGKAPKDVRFVIGFGGSFWALLWERAWAPIVALALLIILWLWKNMMRFGPLREVTLHETQRFSDHLTALGPFYLRIKRPDVLLSAARDAVMARMARTHPQMLAMDDRSRRTFLAQRSKLTMERVQAAMDSPEHAKQQRRQLTLHIQDLQTLRNSL